MENVVRHLITIIPVVGMSFWLAASLKMIGKAYKKYKGNTEKYSKNRLLKLVGKESWHNIVYVGLCAVNIVLVNYRSQDPDYNFGSYIYNDTLSKVIHWLVLMGITSLVTFMGAFAYLKYAKLEGIINADDQR